VDEELSYQLNEFMINEIYVDAKSIPNRSFWPLMC